MLSFSAFAVLAIAAQSLFAGVDAVALRQSSPRTSFTIDRSANSQSTAKRQQNPDIQTGQAAGGGPFNGTIGPIAAGFNTSAFGPFNVNATFGLGDEGTNEFSALFEYLIPAIFNGLTGTVNNVSLTGVPGQPSSLVGLGFSPADSATHGGFNFTSAFPKISGPFSEILSSFFNGSNMYTFPIIPPGFTGLNGTMPGFLSMNGTTLPFGNFSQAGGFPNGLPSSFPGGLPSGIPTNLTNSFPTDLPSGIPTNVSGSLPTDFPSEFLSDLPSGTISAVPYPTFDSSVLPSDVASSIQVELSSVASSISQALPSISSDTVLPTAL